MKLKHFTLTYGSVVLKAFSAVHQPPYNVRPVAIITQLFGEKCAELARLLHHPRIVYYILNLLTYRSLAKPKSLPRKDDMSAVSCT